jgi:hypothetical protein
MSERRYRRPTVPEVLPLVRAYLEIDGNYNGGSLHIVIDDGNVADDHVEFCRRFAMRDQEIYADHPYGVPEFMSDPPDLAGAMLATILLSMSRTQRLKIVRSL